MNYSNKLMILYPMNNLIMIIHRIIFLSEYKFARYNGKFNFFDRYMCINYELIYVRSYTGNIFQGKEKIYENK